MKSFVNFLIGVTIFFPSYIFFKYPFELYAYYIVMLILGPIWVFKYGFSKRLLLIFSILCAAGVYQITQGNNTTANFLKTFLGVFLAYSFYYLAIKHYDFDFKKVLRIYFKGAIIMAILGISQEFFFIIGFKPGHDYTWILNKWGHSTVMMGGQNLMRVNALLSEPSSYAMTLSPALFLVLCSILVRKEIFHIRLWEKVVLLTGFFFSLSSSGYAAFGFIIIILAINYFRPIMIIAATGISILSFNLLYTFDKGFKDRFDSLEQLINYGSEDLVNGTGFINEDINGSSFVWYENFQVALKSAKRSPLMGSGLGSHPVSFERYSVFMLIDEDTYRITNSQDANSQFNRILSELGFTGIALVALFLFWFFVKKRKDMPNQEFWLISGACLVIILSYLFRFGHYFTGGYPLFVWGYYINYRNSRMELKKQNNLTLNP